MVYHTDPMILWELAKARRTDLMLGVEVNRLAGQARAGTRGFHESLLMGLGEFLISVGLKLKARYEPVSYRGIHLRSSLDEVPT